MTAIDKKRQPCPKCHGSKKETSIGGVTHECSKCDGWGFLRSPSRAQVKHRDHKRLWRMVEGAVVDAFRSHPEYLTDHGDRSAVESITKRVVGTLAGNAYEVRKHGRGGGS